MKLTLYVICDALRTEGVACDYFGSGKEDPCGRPVFREPDRKAEGRLTILAEGPKGDELLPKGSYVSFSDAWSGRISGRSALLVIREDPADIRTLFNRLQEVFDRFDGLEAGLTEVIESEKGYGCFIDVCTKCLGGKISLVDYDFNYVAYSESMKEATQIVDERIGAEEMSEHLANPEFERVRYERDIFEYAMGTRILLCYNFYRNDVYIGRLVTLWDPWLSKESSCFFVRYLAGRLEIMIDRYGSFMREAGRKTAVKQALLDVLSRGDEGGERLKETMGTVGWETDDRFVLIRIHPEFRHERVLHTGYFASLIEARWNQSAVVEYRDYIVILADLTKAFPDRDIRAELGDFLREYLMLASCSRVFTGCARVCAAYRQTEIAFRLGRVSDPTLWILHFDDYALAYWIENGCRDFLPEEICAPALLSLRETDREKGTDYYRTLRALFDAGFNFSQAADRLYIHRTTLINRAAKMRELTGIDLDDPDMRLYLELSIRYCEQQDQQ